VKRKLALKKALHLCCSVINAAVWRTT